MMRSQSTPATRAGSPTRPWPRARLTALGKLCTGLAVAFYLAAITSQSSLLLFLAGMLLACVALNAAVAWYGLLGVDLLAPKSARLTEGRRWWQPWKIANRGRFPAGFLDVQHPAGRLFSTSMIEPGEELTVTPDLVFTKRGVHANTNTQVASTYPFGLIRATIQANLPGEVIVYPAVYEVDPPGASALDSVFGGKSKGRRPANSGFYFAGVRPFQPGDALKQIHWKSSSKGRGLMVRTYDEELAGRMSLILDGGHRGDPEMLDDAVRAAGSILLAALHAGHHVVWADLARGEVRTEPPAADGNAILESLARLECKPGCLTAESLVQLRERLPRKGTLHLVLTELPREIPPTLQQWADARQAVVIYLPATSQLPEGALRGCRVLRYEKHALHQSSASAAPRLPDKDNSAPVNRATAPAAAPSPSGPRL